MSLYKAVLELREREMEILWYYTVFERKTDNKGRPCTSTSGGKVTFSVASTGDTFLAEWITNCRHLPISGRIVLFDLKEGKKMRELHFTDAFLTYYKEECNTSKSLPVRTTCTLTARILTIGDAYLENRW